MLSRRDFGKAALAALPVTAAAKKIDSAVQGVQFGLQSYVFTGIGLPQAGLIDQVVSSMVAAGLGECDIYDALVQPPELADRIRAGGPSGPGAQVPPEVAAARAQARAEHAQWRMTVSLDYFRAIRKKFEDAGIEIYGLSSFPGSTEEELSRTFDIAEVCGAKLVTVAITLSAARKIAGLVERREFVVGMQGRPDMTGANPDAISKPENYEEVMGLSRHFAISMDIGDATAGGYDTLSFVEAHHERIAMLYLKDRRKDHTSVPWGEGDTPVADMVRLVRDKKYPIRCYLDCDYKTTDRAADVKRSFEFAKAALNR